MALKRTDGEFWQILRFDFIEGAPYTADDVEATGDGAVGGEGPEESAVHVIEG